MRKSQSRKSLLKAAIGQWVRVVQFDAPPQLSHQLIQLGLSPGDSVRVTRHAPLGGPYLVEFSGRSVALGRGIAAQIIIEDIACDSH